MFRCSVDSPKKYRNEKAKIIKLLAEYVLKRMSRRLMWQAGKAVMLLKFIRLEKVLKSKFCSFDEKLISYEFSAISNDYIGM